MYDLHIFLGRWLDSPSRLSSVSSGRSTKLNYSVQCSPLPTRSLYYLRHLKLIEYLLLEYVWLHGIINF